MYRQIADASIMFETACTFSVPFVPFSQYTPKGRDAPSDDEDCCIPSVVAQKVSFEHTTNITANSQLVHIL